MSILINPWAKNASRQLKAVNAETVGLAGALQLFLTNFIKG
jgi:hypothetical protein